MHLPNLVLLANFRINPLEMGKIHFPNGYIIHRINTRTNISNGVSISLNNSHLAISDARLWYQTQEQVIFSVVRNSKASLEHPEFTNLYICSFLRLDTDLLVGSYTNVTPSKGIPEYRKTYNPYKAKPCLLYLQCWSQNYGQTVVEWHAWKF